MSKSKVIQQILVCPERYQETIQQANYDDLKIVFSTYVQHYTCESSKKIMENYSEQELREKLLGSSQTVISTLKQIVGVL